MSNLNWKQREQVSTSDGEELISYDLYINDSKILTLHSSTAERFIAAGEPRGYTTAYVIKVHNETLAGSLEIPSGSPLPAMKEEKIMPFLVDRLGLKKEEQPDYLDDARVIRERLKSRDEENSRRRGEEMSPLLRDFY